MAHRRGGGRGSLCPSNAKGRVSVEPWLSGSVVGLGDEMPDGLGQPGGFLGPLFRSPTHTARRGWNIAAVLNQNIPQNTALILQSALT